MYLLSRVCSRPAREQDPEGGQRHCGAKDGQGRRTTELATTACLPLCLRLINARTRGGGKRAHLIDTGTRLSPG